MTSKWAVSIPAGRWMAGIHRFKTMRAACGFITRWNETEAKSGYPTLHFLRSGPNHFEGA